MLGGISFFIARISDVLQRIPVPRTEFSKVSPGLRKTEVLVWTTPHFVGGLVILPIIVPETDRTDVIISPHRQRAETAARAGDAIRVFHGDCRLTPKFSGRNRRYAATTG